MRSLSAPLFLNMDEKDKDDSFPDTLRIKVIHEIELQLRKEKILKFGIDLILLILFVSICFSRLENKLTMINIFHN